MYQAQRISAFIVLMKPANLTARQSILQYEFLRGPFSITISSEKPNFLRGS
jgi:hypothetical protein